MDYTLVQHKAVARVLVPIAENSNSRKIDQTLWCRQLFLPRTCANPGKWSGIVVVKRSVSLLVCKARDKSICMDPIIIDSLLSEGSSEVGAKESPDKQFLNRFSSSLDFMLSFVENDEETNNKILDELCRNGKLEKATKLVDLMTSKNQIPNSHMCISLIRGLINQTQTNKATEVLRQMVMSGGTPDIITYNMLISALCKKGLLKRAVEILEEMSSSGCSPDMITYNTILRAMLGQGKYRVAVDFWMDQLRKGSPPYLITSNILIKQVCEHSGVVRGFDVMQDLTREGCSFNIEAYNTVLNFASKQDNFRTLVLAFRSLISNRLEPNDVTYHRVLYCLCKRGHWDAVEEILSCMSTTSSHLPDPVTYNILINGFCKNGLLYRAIDMFILMVSQNISPNIITYHAILSALSKEPLEEYVFDLLECLNGSNCSPNVITYGIVIDGMTKRGCLERAMEVYNLMVDRGVCPNVVIYRCLIFGFCRANLFCEAAEFLKLMGKIQREIRFDSYKCIIVGLCRLKKLDTAIEVLEMMKSSLKRLDPTAFYAVVTAVASEGMREEATRLGAKLRGWKVLK